MIFPDNDPSSRLYVIPSQSLPTLPSHPVLCSSPHLKGCLQRHLEDESLHSTRLHPLTTASTHYSISLSLSSISPGTKYASLSDKGTGHRSCKKMHYWACGSLSTFYVDLCPVTTQHPGPVRILQTQLQSKAPRHYLSVDVTGAVPRKLTEAGMSMPVSVRECSWVTPVEGWRQGWVQEWGGRG